MLKTGIRLCAEDGKYTTWSNVLRQREKGSQEGRGGGGGGERFVLQEQEGGRHCRGRPRTREENNNDDSNRKSRYINILPVIGLNKLDFVYILKGRCLYSYIQAES
jgi:hypothetical protein